jgi:nitrite reductase/ring-hydroxylating ferredoxin subunit
VASFLTREDDMTNASNGKSRTNGSANGHEAAGTKLNHADETWREAYGASKIGPYDYCPRLGFREYWYPGVETKDVGTKKPKKVTMLGEEIVFFRDKDGKVAALSDWCPHRGARLSLGVCEFPGTITCPYHGYTFDGAGQCVAGLIDSPESPLVPKLRAQRYPTAEWKGIVFVWMGKTEPVPLEEDLPPPLLDEKFTSRRYMRTKVWEVNWTEPVLQGIDFHEFYLHRGLNFWRLFHWRLGFFRPKPVYQGTVKVTDERDNAAGFNIAPPVRGQAYYPGVDAKWPTHVWWRRLKALKRGGFGGSTDNNAAGIVGDGKYVQLPSVIYFGGDSIQLRWNVPLDEEYTTVWTFTPVRTAKSWLGRRFQDVWYYCWRLYSSPIYTNEKEDLMVFMKDRLNLEAPQKLGPLDTGVIYFRRHLAKRARDYARLGSATGTLKGTKGEAAPAEKETVSVS